MKSLVLRYRSRVVLLRGVQAALSILELLMRFVLSLTSILNGWLERGTHLFARCGAFNEPL
jgi:hypothetical protein